MRVAGIYLLDEPAFASNLNQMFVLGRFDGALFEEAYNEFPYARAFRVRRRPDVSRSEIPLRAQVPEKSNRELIAGGAAIAALTPRPATRR